MAEYRDTVGRKFLEQQLSDLFFLFLGESLDFLFKYKNFYFGRLGTGLETVSLNYVGVSLIKWD